MNRRRLQSANPVRRCLLPLIVIRIPKKTPSLGSVAVQSGRFSSVFQYIKQLPRKGFAAADMRDGYSTIAGNRTTP